VAASRKCSFTTIASGSSSGPLARHEQLLSHMLAVLHTGLQALGHHLL
jgi:hypothetical protein